MFSTHCFFKIFIEYFVYCSASFVIYCSWYGADVPFLSEKSRLRGISTSNSLASSSSLLFYICSTTSLIVFLSFYSRLSSMTATSTKQFRNKLLPTLILLCHATLCFPFVTLFGHRCKTAIVFFTFDSLSRLEEGHEHENWHAAHGLLKRATWTPNDQNFYRCPSTTHNEIHQIYLPSPKRRLVHHSMVGLGF